MSAQTGWQQYAPGPIGAGYYLDLGYDMAAYACDNGVEIFAWVCLQHDLTIWEAPERYASLEEAKAAACAGARAIMAAWETALARVGA